MTEIKKKGGEKEPQKQHKKVKSKSYNSLWVILGIVVVIFLGVVFSQSLNFGGPNCKNVQTPYESQEEYMKTEYYTESVPYTDKECENKNIAYSIDNFRLVSNDCNKKQDICNKYFLGICSDKTTFCIDKTISCALDLRNLDSEKRGVFTVRFNFFDVGTKKNIKNDDDSKLVYAQTSNIFRGTSRITSSGVSGNANKQLSCSYDLPNLPTKQICKDVTKYREVQRERQVTAYRPVTKYKTEKKCD